MVRGLLMGDLSAVITALGLSDSVSCCTVRKHTAKLLDHSQELYQADLQIQMRFLAEC